MPWKISIFLFVKTSLNIKHQRTFPRDFSYVSVTQHFDLNIVFCLTVDTFVLGFVVSCWSFCWSPTTAPPGTWQWPSSTSSRRHLHSHPVSALCQLKISLFVINHFFSVVYILTCFFLQGHSYGNLQHLVIIFAVWSLFKCTTWKLMHFYWLHFAFSFSLKLHLPPPSRIWEWPFPMPRYPECHPEKISL